ncbi:MAG: hypothetical protein IKR18_07275 [Bacteroidaceae bacterium]|nr:hypothetical protein [Bacteroidaceae bacterium]
MKNRLVLLSAFALAALSLFAIDTKVQCSDEEREVYQLYQDEIDACVNFRAEEEVLRLRLGYRVPKYIVPKLEHYVRDREFRRVCQEYLYPNSIGPRMRNKLRIDSVYQDSIDMLLIPHNIHQISSENLSFALQESGYVWIDSVQYGKIMDKAIDIAHRIRKNHDINVWNEEMEFLQSLLNQNQLTMLLYRKNNVAARTNANNAWEKLVNAGIAEQFDSVKEMESIQLYYLEREKYMALYRYKPSIRKKALAQVGKRKPKSLIMLDAYDKQERMEEKERENGTIGKEFVW